MTSIPHMPLFKTGLRNLLEEDRMLNLTCHFERSVSMTPSEKLNSIHVIILSDRRISSRADTLYISYNSSRFGNEKAFDQMNSEMPEC